MYKKAWCTRKVVVLLNKPIALFSFSLLLPLSLLKLPSDDGDSNDDDDDDDDEEEEEEDSIWCAKFWSLTGQTGTLYH